LVPWDIIVSIFACQFLGRAVGTRVIRAKASSIRQAGTGASNASGTILIHMLL